MAAPETTNDKDDGENPRASQTHDASGVDLTLIRWMATKTPAERLKILEQQVRGIIKIRNARNRS